jgi:SAM-dependent methyltransferase
VTLGGLLEEAVLLCSAVIERTALARGAAWSGWDYDLPLERERHERILAAAEAASGGTRWESVLEVGCAEGHFTTRLAQHTSALAACDVSAEACRRTAVRCAALPHVSVAQLDLERDPLPGIHDVVFAMDVLEYVHGRGALSRVASKLARALRPGGALAVTATRLPPRLERCWWARWLVEGGAEIIDLLAGRPDLQLAHRQLHETEVVSGGPNEYCAHVIAVFVRV